MNRPLYWGAGILILLLIAGGSFLFYSQYSQLQQLKQETAEADKLREENNKPIADNEPPTASEGFKMIPHDDHFHEVPIDAPDTWEEQPMPVVQPSSETITPISEGGIAIKSPTENKPLSPITFEVYEKQVTQAWANLPRDDWGNPLTDLPDTPGEAGTWQSLDEVLRAGRLWHKLNAQEAKRLHASHARMKAYYNSKGVTEK